MKEKKIKRRFGDRKDARLVREMDSLHFVMGQVYTKRTDNEAYISQIIDMEPLMNWLEKNKNNDPEFKFTFFHLIVTAMLKMLYLRPKLNRFYANKRYYERHKKSAGFIVKRQFTDESKEGMAIINADPEDNVFTIHEKIKKIVIPCREGKNNGATEDGMDFFLKAPYFFSKFLFRIIRFIAERGWLPQSLTAGDSNFCSIFLTNLGSIGLQCGYHHLSNWGTTSIFVVVGDKKLRPVYDQNGIVTMKDTLRIGLTIDERIADGFYYSKCVKMIKYLLEHPEELEKNMDAELEMK